MVRRAITNDGLAADQGRLVVDGFGIANCCIDSIGIVAIDVADNMPAVCFIALGNIFLEPAFGVTVDADAVVIPESDQLAETESTCKGACLVGNTSIMQPSPRNT